MPKFQDFMLLEIKVILEIFQPFFGAQELERKEDYFMRNVKIKDI